MTKAERIFRETFGDCKKMIEDIGFKKDVGFDGLSTKSAYEEVYTRTAHEVVKHISKMANHIVRAIEFNINTISEKMLEIQALEMVRVSLENQYIVGKHEYITAKCAVLDELLEMVEAVQQQQTEEALRAEEEEEEEGRGEVERITYASPISVIVNVRDSEDLEIVTDSIYYDNVVGYDVISGEIARRTIEPYIENADIFGEYITIKLESGQTASYPLNQIDYISCFDGRKPVEATVEHL